MNQPAFDPSDALGRRLKSSAQATRPAFSTDLHARIVAAATARPSQGNVAIALDSRAGSHRSWGVWLAVAASLLLLATAAWFAVRAPQGIAVPQLATAGNSTEQGPGGLLAANDRELAQRAQAAAAHWDSLDADARTAARWLVDELPFDFDLSESQ